MSLVADYDVVVVAQRDVHFAVIKVTTIRNQLISASDSNRADHLGRGLL